MKLIPERWRWAHRLYAATHNFFWFPCPLCGRYFGGHEWRDIDGKSSTIYPVSAYEGSGICPDCTRAGSGQRQEFVMEDGEYKLRVMAPGAVNAKEGGSDA